MRLSSRAFSLIEVVIALGIAAGGVAVIFALLSSLIRQSDEAVDLQTALRLSGAIEDVLISHMRRNGGFPAGIQNGLTLVANKDGSNIRLGTLDDDVNTDDQLPAFYIAVRAFSSGELAYQIGRPVLPLQVQIYWPYRAVKAAGGISNGGNYQSVSYLVTLTP